jgi:hypothetical protein
MYECKMRSSAELLNIDLLDNLEEFAASII